jgi:hypothetical protein
MNATADLLRRTADKIDAGEVAEPVVSLQFIVTGEPDQDAALTATTGVYPGLTWTAHLMDHALLGPAVNIHGRDGNVLVTVSARADRLRMATVASLTTEVVPA